MSRTINAWIITAVLIISNAGGLPTAHAFISAFEREKTDDDRILNFLNHYKMTFDFAKIAVSSTSRGIFNNDALQEYGVTLGHYFRKELCIRPAIITEKGPSRGKRIAVKAGNTCVSTNIGLYYGTRTLAKEGSYNHRLEAAKLKEISEHFVALPFTFEIAIPNDTSSRLFHGMALNYTFRKLLKSNKHFERTNLPQGQNEHPSVEAIDLSDTNINKYHHSISGRVFMLIPIGLYASLGVRLNFSDYNNFASYCPPESTNRRNPWPHRNASKRNELPTDVFVQFGVDIAMVLRNIYQAMTPGPDTTPLAYNQRAI